MKDEMLNGFAQESQLMMTRRQLFGRSALGLGTAAMAGLMGPDVFGATKGNAALNGGLHHVAKAKRVIYLFMSGGPSHLDLWDYKPKMQAMYGKDLPKEVRDGQRITGMTSRQKTLPVCPTKYKFTKHENNADGLWVSELLPHTATVAKELCVVHTAFTEAINHDPAITYIQSGSQIPGRPSLGAWLSYGLGSANENLPNYLVMHARTKHPEQSLFGRLWGSGFMPSRHQGVLLRSEGDLLLYLNNPVGVTKSTISGRSATRCSSSRLLKSPAAAAMQHTNGTVAKKGSFETCLIVAALMATPPAIAARALQRRPKYSVSRNFQMSCRQLRTMQQRDPVIIQRGAEVAPTIPQYRHNTVKQTINSWTSTSKNCCRPKATNEQFER